MKLIEAVAKYELCPKNNRADCVDCILNDEKHIGDAPICSLFHRVEERCKKIKEGEK